MSLKHQFEFDPKDPFGNDKLQREEEAITLTNLVKNYADGFVLAINNEWGAGKTTFLKMWKAHLKLQGVESLYFNAWENDHQTDVLVALLSELDELKDTEKEKFKTLIEKAAPFASSVLTASIKALAKTSGADGIVQAFIDAAAEGGEKLLNTEIDTYTSRKEGLKEFKKSLADYTSAVGGENPLVFVIDELDRCRPSYAVEVLEQIKHVFSVPGIVFVLAIDKKQLGHAVKGVYGSPEMDDVEYLRRFIDVEFSLPEPSIDNYVRYLFEVYDLDENFEKLGLSGPSLEKYSGEFVGYSSLLTAHFGLNLRLIEKLFSHLKVVYSGFTISNQMNPGVYVLFCIVRLKSFSADNLLDSLKYRKLKLQSLIDKLIQTLPVDSEKNAILHLILLIVHLYNNELGFSRNLRNELTEPDPNLTNGYRPAHDYGNLKINQKWTTDFLYDLQHRSHIQDFRISQIIANIELSQKYFVTE